MNNFHTPFYVLNFQQLRKQGFAVFKTDAVNLVFTLRGGYMVDVFDLDSAAHSGYIDFDIAANIMLAHAFGSPVIGLPFSNDFRKAVGKDILPFEDLRRGHDVGFYVEKAYRNKEEKHLWNLDVILMAIAIETAFEEGVEIFTVKPTGDRARYYRSKFFADIRPTTKSDFILDIHLSSVRKKLKHIELQEAEGKAVSFRVKGGPDIKI